MFRPCPRDDARGLPHPRFQLLHRRDGRPAHARLEGEPVGVLYRRHALRPRLRPHTASGHRAGRRVPGHHRSLAGAHRVPQRHGQRHQVPRGHRRHARRGAGRSGTGDDRRRRARSRVGQQRPSHHVSKPTTLDLGEDGPGRASTSCPPASTRAAASSAFASCAASTAPRPSPSAIPSPTSSPPPTWGLRVRGKCAQGPAAPALIEENDNVYITRGKVVEGWIAMANALLAAKA